MPSVPLYGYDQLEPSMLNNAKRRIVGLMDTSQEALTEKPDKDPTGGKQNGFVEKLTEEIYTTIRDIEVLDSYISDSSSIAELRLLNRATSSSLKSIRTELKRGASQIVSINNDLRKINTTYDRLRPNIVYTDLKIFTYFSNSVKILKQSALTFFNIVDDFIEDVIKTEDPSSTYVKPSINEDDEDIETPPIESEQSISGVPIDTLLGEPAPQYSPTQIPGPDPIPPPPPPKKRLPTNLGKQMKEYKALVRKVLNDANVIDPQVATDLMNLAEDKVRNDKTFYNEAELQAQLTQLLAQASAPSTAQPSQPNYTQQDFNDLRASIRVKLPSNLTPDQQQDIGNALIKLTQSSYPDLPTEDEIDDMIDGVIGATTGTTQQTSTGTLEEEEKQAIKDFEIETGLTATPDVVSRFKTSSKRDQDELYQELDIEASNLLNSASKNQQKALILRISQAQKSRTVRNNSALETYIEFLKAPRIDQSEIASAKTNAKNQKEAREIQRAYDTYLTTASIKTFFKRQEKYNQQIYA